MRRCRSRWGRRSSPCICSASSTWCSRSRPGQLRSRLDLGLVAAAVAIVTVVEVAWLLFADSRSQICSDCPHNAFEVTRSDALANGLRQGQRSVGVVLSVFTVALLVRRWLRASAPERRVGAPVLWAGSAMFAALAI